MDFHFSKEQLRFEEKTREFAAKEISPVVDRLEEDVDFRQELFRKMAKAGFFLLSVPKDNGGYFTDTLSYMLALKAIAKSEAGIAVTMAVCNMVAESIYLYGSPEQQKKYLPQIASGQTVPLSFALTEEFAGSDAKSILMFAKPSGEDYFLTGEKWFITNGDQAKLLVVMAKTDLEKDAKGMTAFLVEGNTPGMTVIKKEKKLGLLTANLVRLSFDRCCIPKTHILGKVGEGFKIAMSSLDSGRLGIAAQAVGLAEAAFEAACKHAKERKQFGRPIAENQAVAFKLADMHVKLNASKLLLYKACWMKDRNIPFSTEASEAKLYCTEAGNEIVNEAVQIFGGYGYIKDWHVEKYFRDVRVTTLYEGTSEIQRLIISRNILNQE